MFAALIAAAVSVPQPAAPVAQPEHANARPALFVVNITLKIIQVE